MVGWPVFPLACYYIFPQSLLVIFTALSSYVYAMHSAWFVGLSITLPGYKKYELFRPPNFPQPLLMIALHSPAIINALSTVGWSVLSFM